MQDGIPQGPVLGTIGRSLDCVSHLDLGFLQRLTGCKGTSCDYFLMGHPVVHEICC